MELNKNISDCSECKYYSTMTNPEQEICKYYGEELMSTEPCKHGEKK
jgi:hypothetical protein